MDASVGFGDLFNSGESTLKIRQETAEKQNRCVQFANNTTVNGRITLEQYPVEWTDTLSSMGQNDHVL